MTRVAICALLLAGTACGSDTDPAQLPAGADACTGLIEGYVAKTRGWPRERYSIREESADTLGARGFAILHESDNVLRPPGGGGKSFHLEVDGACTRVITELAYQ